MIAFLMIMRDILGHGLAEVPLTERNDPIRHSYLMDRKALGKRPSVYRPLSAAPRSDGASIIAWAIRKDSPQLKAALNKFLATNGRDSLNARMIFRRYLLETRYVKRATADAEMKRFRSVIAYFRKYGGQYNLDWMLMAAQGYQESRLDQQARSHVGAIGVMQIMPATGKELNVGDIGQIEANIHGGVKYIRFMIDRYYEDEPMDDLNKVLFAFAAYDCGPGRVRQLRREAAARGLDANVWFDNVERMAAEKIGRETVTYVSNIYKYYVSYLLVQGEYIQRRDLKKKSASRLQ